MSRTFPVICIAGKCDFIEKWAFPKLQICFSSHRNTRDAGLRAGVLLRLCWTGLCLETFSGWPLVQIYTFWDSKLDSLPSWCTLKVNIFHVESHKPCNPSIGTYSRVIWCAEILKADLDDDLPHHHHDQTPVCWAKNVKSRDAKVPLLSVCLCRILLSETSFALLSRKECCSWGQRPFIPRGNLLSIMPLSENKIPFHEWPPEAVYL